MFDMHEIGKKAGLAAASAAIALSCSPAAMAFAADGDREPSASHSAAGSTEVYVQLKADPDKEVSEDSENLRFTIPTEIDFMANADGRLLGPSCSIQNGSVFGIHVTAMTSVFDTDATGGAWNAMTLASVDGSTARNAVGFTVGPATDKLDASEHAVTRDAAHPAAGNVGVPASWSMGAKGSAGDADKVAMTAEGKVNNLDKQLLDSPKTKLCTMTWYVKPGTVTA